MALYEGFIIFAIRKLFQDLTDKFFFIAKKIIETMSSSKFSNVEVKKMCLDQNGPNENYTQMKFHLLLIYLAK